MKTIAARLAESRQAEKHDQTVNVLINRTQLKWVTQKAAKLGVNRAELMRKLIIIAMDEEKQPQ